MGRGNRLQTVLSRSEAGQTGDRRKSGADRNYRGVAAATLQPKRSDCPAFGTGLLLVEILRRLRGPSSPGAASRALCHDHPTRPEPNISAVGIFHYSVAVWVCFTVGRPPWVSLGPCRRNDRQSDRGRRDA